MVYNIEDMARISDSCRYPMVLTSSVARYESHSAFYFELGGDYIPSNIIIQNVLTFAEIPITIYETTNYVTTTSLPNNSYFQIKGTNSCGEPVVIYSFNTFKPNDPYIVVSDRMMNALNDHIDNFSSIPFYTYLNNRQDIPLIERIAFVQQYFLNNTLIQDFYQNEIPPVNTANRLPCTCREVRTGNFAFDAVTLQTDPLNSNFGFIKPLRQTNLPDKHGLGKNARSWYVRDSYGAGKYAQQWTEGYKAKSSPTHSDSLSYQGTNIFRVRILWYCNDGQDLPRDCQCPKEMKTFYKYHSQVKSSSVILGGFSFYSREAFNIVEDYGVYSVLNERTGEFSMVDAKLTKAATACNYTISPNYWNNWLDLASSIASAITKATDPKVIALIGSTLSDTSLIKSLKSIINTPYIVPVSCTNNNAKTETMQGIYYATITANQVLRFQLSSHNRSVSGGKRSWQSDGRVLSNGYIATFLPGGMPFDTRDTLCCTPIGSNWMASGVAEGYDPVPFLRSDIADLLQLEGGWNFPIGPSGASEVPTDYGLIWKPSSDPACRGIIYRESGHEELPSVVGYKIMDTSGKIVSAAKIQKTQNEVNAYTIQQALSLKLSPGMYFAIPELSSQQIQPIKIIITK